LSEDEQEVKILSYSFHDGITVQRVKREYCEGPYRGSSLDDLKRWVHFSTLQRNIPAATKEVGKL
jgi:hypothetical protein